MEAEEPKLPDVRSIAWLDVFRGSSLNVRKAEIRTEHLSHSCELICKPDQIIVLCLHMPRALLSDWQMLVELLSGAHVHGTLPNLLQVRHNGRIEEELGIRCAGVKLE